LTTPPAGAVTGSVTLTATVTDAISIANVKFFVNTDTLIGTATSAPFTVQWDSTTAPNGPAALTAVATDVDGNVGTSPAVNVTVAPVVTLTQLQEQVFTPLCSGCHNGSQPAGGRLPGSQNLTAGNTFSNIVGVASLEQPSLMRVKPGDPDNSYLIHKVEGAADISGSQMPLGGPVLSQATIDQIRSWISAGAANN
jgi:mono/diheme cytochrome c family protein